MTEAIDMVADLLDANWNTSNIAKPVMKKYWEVRLPNVLNTTFVLFYETLRNTELTTLDLGLRTDTYLLRVEILGKARSTVLATIEEIRRILEANRFPTSSEWYYIIIKRRTDLSNPEKPMYRFVLDIEVLATPTVVSA